MFLRMIVYLNQQHCRKTIHRGPFTEDEVNRIVAKWEAAGKKNRVYGGLYKAVEPERHSHNRHVFRLLDKPGL